MSVRLGVWAHLQKGRTTWTAGVGSPPTQPLAEVGTRAELFWKPYVSLSGGDEAEDLLDLLSPVRRAGV
jgi:hypothetical protein